MTSQNDRPGVETQRARRYDPELLASLASPDLTTALHTLEEQRSFTASVMARFGRQSDARVQIEDVVLAGSPALRLRTYRPTGDITGGLVWVHGGAFCLGQPEMDDDICRDAAEHHSLLVVAPDYRLAPENPYPAADEDCAQAVRWLHDILRRTAPGAGMAIAGASAGGALALRTGLDWVHSGERLDRLVLAYPVVDASLARPSMKTYEHAPVFDAHQADIMWSRYLATTDRNAWPSPLTDPALDQLPLTLVITAEHDPLRDEGLALVQELIERGVPVESVHMAGTYHAFDRFAPDTGPAKRFRTTVKEFLGRPVPLPSEE